MEAELDETKKAEVDDPADDDEEALGGGEAPRPRTHGTLSRAGN